MQTCSPLTIPAVFNEFGGDYTGSNFRRGLKSEIRLDPQRVLWRISASQELSFMQLE